MPPPLQADFWPLTLKVVSEPRVTWATSVPILVFLGLSVLDLGPMYATDVRRRQTSDAHHRLMPPTLGAGHNNPEAVLLKMDVIYHSTSIFMLIQWSRSIIKYTCRGSRSVRSSHQTVSDYTLRPWFPNTQQSRFLTLQPLGTSKN